MLIVEIIVIQEFLYLSDNIVHKHIRIHLKYIILIYKNVLIQKLSLINYFYYSIFVEYMLKGTT